MSKAQFQTFTHITQLCATQFKLFPPTPALRGGFYLGSFYSDFQQNEFQLVKKVHFKLFGFVRILLLLHKLQAIFQNLSTSAIGTFVFPFLCLLWHWSFGRLFLALTALLWVFKSVFRRIKQTNIIYVCFIFTSCCTAYFSKNRKHPSLFKSHILF